MIDDSTKLRLVEEWERAVSAFARADREDWNWTDPPSYNRRMAAWNELADETQRVRSAGLPKSWLMDCRGPLSRSEVTRLIAGEKESLR